jgi:hypothetical protein
MRKQPELDLGLNTESLLKELSDTKEIKKCDTCKEYLPLEQFYNNNYKPDGLSSTCKACSRENYDRKKQHYKGLYTMQEGLCAICEMTTEENGKDFAVDHCHKTGKVRALLCNSCNTGIGTFRDSPYLLNKAIEYLDKYNEKTTD